MKPGLTLLVSFLFLFAGCGDEPQSRTATYPPLDESPPPPMPEETVAPDDVEDEEPGSGLTIKATGDGWVDQTARSQGQIQELRRQAAQAAPDDPFALSEEDIDALSKQHGVLVH
ncbi:MAG: hypothetical protein ACOX9C_07530 [Kiritimatiellia bacterium]|jgi:hypothetical protein